MISEVLELCVEDGRVSHSLSICVVDHVHSGLGGGRDGGGGWYACGTRPRELVAMKEMPEHFPSVR